MFLRETSKNLPLVDVASCMMYRRCGLKIVDNATGVRGRIMPNNQKDCPVGLDERCRDLNGEIRQKRGDTLVKTLRKTYGDDFARVVRSDTRLDTLRERAGGVSLSTTLLSLNQCPL